VVKVVPYDGTTDTEHILSVSMIFDEEVYVGENNVIHVVSTWFDETFTIDEYQVGLRALRLYPSFFYGNVTLTLAAGALIDGVGNPVEEFTWSFQTMPFPDQEGPLLVLTKSDSLIFSEMVVPNPTCVNVTWNERGNITSLCDPGLFTFDGAMLLLDPAATELYGNSLTIPAEALTDAGGVNWVGDLSGSYTLSLPLPPELDPEVYFPGGLVTTPGEGGDYHAHILLRTTGAISRQRAEIKLVSYAKVVLGDTLEWGPEEAYEPAELELVYEFGGQAVFAPASTLSVNALYRVTFEVYSATRHLKTISAEFAVSPVASDAGAELLASSFTNDHQMQGESTLSFSHYVKELNSSKIRLLLLNDDGEVEGEPREITASKLSSPGVVELSIDWNRTWVAKYHLIVAEQGFMKDK
jgi:hypothetical protein